MTKYIYAQKGTNVTRFSRMVWKNMGTNKNGWEEITEAAYNKAVKAVKDGKAVPNAGSTPTAPAEVGNETEYKKLMEQGKGLEKDGNLATALMRYQAALAIKSSPALKSRITKLNNAIEKEGNAKVRTGLIQQADEALAKNEFETALELYGKAGEIEEDEALTAKIEAAEKAMEDSVL